MQNLKMVRVALKEMPYFSDSSVSTTWEAARLMIDQVKSCDRENVCILNLDTKGKPLNASIVSTGDISSSIVHPREVLKATILSNASAILMIHNHPSGQIEPSREDIDVTERMKFCCGLMGIYLCDHMIVGHDTDRYYSFKEQNEQFLNDLSGMQKYFGDHPKLLEPEGKTVDDLKFCFSAGDITVYSKGKGDKYIYEREDSTFKKRVELSKNVCSVNNFFDILSQQYINRFCAGDHDKKNVISKMSYEFCGAVFDRMRREIPPPSDDRIGLSVFREYCKTKGINAKMLSKELGRPIPDIRFDKEKGYVTDIKKSSSSPFGHRQKFKVAEKQLELKDVVHEPEI